MYLPVACIRAAGVVRRAGESLQDVVAVLDDAQCFHLSADVRDIEVQLGELHQQLLTRYAPLPDRTLDRCEAKVQRQQELPF
jgi:hypothetical protein